MDLIKWYTPYLAAGGFYCFANLASMAETWNKGIEYHIWKSERYLYDGTFEKKNEEDIKETYKNGLGSFLDAEISKPGRKAGYAILKVSYSLIDNLSGPERIHRMQRIRGKTRKD